MASACITDWQHGIATVRSTQTGKLSEVPADTLVIAETPVSETALATDLVARSTPFHLIGDAVAPRRASIAFFEGRELARRL